MVNSDDNGEDELDGTLDDVATAPVATSGLICLRVTCEDGQSIKHIIIHNIGSLFQNGAKNRDLRCVSRPSAEGAGCNTSRIQN